MINFFYSCAENSSEETNQKRITFDPLPHISYAFKYFSENDSLPNLDADDCGCEYLHTDNSSMCQV